MDITGIEFQAQAGAAYQAQLDEEQEAADARHQEHKARLTERLEAEGIDPSAAEWSGGTAIISGIHIYWSGGSWTSQGEMHIQCELCRKTIAANLYKSDSILRLAGQLYAELKKHQEKDCPKAPPIHISNYQYATGLMKSVPWITADEGPATHVQRTLIYAVLALVDAINEHSQPKY